MLSVNISSLDPGLHQLLIEADAQEAGLDAEQFRDVRVDVRLDRGDERIYVVFQADALARLECDRTLKMFDMTVSGSYELLFVPEEEAAVREGGKENVRVLHPDDQEIDITDAVRDTIMLAVPQRKVAPGADEVEIPTEFGAPEDDDIADPRWEALRKLRDDSE
jgi:uncharacterized protein